MEPLQPEPEFGTSIYPNVISSVQTDKSVVESSARRSSRSVQATVHLHYSGKNGKFTSGKTLSEMNNVRMRLGKRPTVAKEKLLCEVKKRARQEAWENCHAETVTLKLRGVPGSMDGAFALLSLAKAASAQVV